MIKRLNLGLNPGEKPTREQLVSLLRSLNLREYEIRDRYGAPTGKTTEKDWEISLENLLKKEVIWETVFIHFDTETREFLGFDYQEVSWIK